MTCSGLKKKILIEIVHEIYNHFFISFVVPSLLVRTYDSDSAFSQSFIPKIKVNLPSKSRFLKDCASIKACTKSRLYENTSTSSQTTDKYHNTYLMILVLSYEPQLLTKTHSFFSQCYVIPMQRKKIIN